MNESKVLYAVMGNPIEHSKSPLIHAAFAKQLGISIDYWALLIDTQAGAFNEAVKDFKAANGKGLNITVPFKQSAWALTKHYHSESAKKAQAVNTLWFNEDGEIVGDNTDGVGLIRDITQNHGMTIHGKKVLILGAGGAVRGVLQYILQESPAQCTIANRTHTKTLILVESFSKDGDINACTYDSLAGQTFDLIINGTSASLQNTLPPLPNGIAQGAVCYDMAYGSNDTIFMQWAREQGAIHVLDGLGMLVEQAAESFLLWHGVSPDTQLVIQELRTHVT